MSGYLNFSKLQKGQRILGVIKTVNDFDLVLSLPNQLSGFVACDCISPHLTSLFSQAAADAASKGGSEEGGSPASLPSLKDYYRAGELVVATITTVEGGKKVPTGEKVKKRLGLSLLPSAVNASALESGRGCEGMVVMGTVVSREDRGFMVDLSVSMTDGANESVVGFIADQDGGNTEGWLRIGKSTPFIITSAYEQRSSRVVSLAATSRMFAKTQLRGGKLPIEALRCGSLVEVEVKGPTESTKTTFGSGPILVQFSGQHTGQIDILNLPELLMRKRTRDLDLAEHFPPGKKLLARIVHVDEEEKAFHLSVLQSILHWQPAPIPATGELGRRVQACPIIRVDSGLGVLLSLPATGDETSPSNAYVHISRLSNERVERLEGSPFKVGSKHDARLIDWDAFASLFQASLQSSVLKETFLRTEDVHVGQIVRGEVLRIESYGLLVSLGERVRAICPVAQVAELATESVLRSSYQLGQRYKFRVLDVTVESRRITLTRKRGLLDTLLPILSSWNDIQPGNQHDGQIVALGSYGCLVRFFGGVKGIVPVGEMSDEYVERPQESYFVGQVVRCRIVKSGLRQKAEDNTTMEGGERELVLSLRKKTGPKELPTTLLKNKKRATESTMEGTAKRAPLMT